VPAAPAQCASTVSCLTAPGLLWDVSCAPLTGCVPPTHASCGLKASVNSWRWAAQQQDGFCVATFAINEAVGEYRENDALLLSADNTDVRQPVPACGLLRVPASWLSI